MLKKILVSITVLVLILALASVSALAQGGNEKKRPPTDPPPTEPPATEPPATEPPGPPSETPPPDPPPVVIPDTGDLYGDLYVILRDENGVPILHSEEVTFPGDEDTDPYTVVVLCIQPISTVDGSVTIETYDGSITITAYAGEPFALPSYADPLGDLVECELPEEMATWVQAVDFGRLNLGRAPDAVIAHGFDEAVNKMNSATGIDIDPAGRLTLLIDGEWKTIDAPAENLALYVKMMLDGHWITLDTTPIEPGGGGGKGGGGGNGGGGGPPPGDGPSTEPRPVLSEAAIALLGQIGYANLGNVDNILNNHDLLLAASLLAASADKGGTFTIDSVIYINSVYGINQVGTLLDEVVGKTYFDFRNRYIDADGNSLPYLQDRSRTYSSRSSGDCRNGRIWVLQPTGGVTYSAMCIEILAYENSDHNPRIAGVHFTDMVETYETVFDEDGNPLAYDFIDNVRGFAQSADDALRVIEYIHNYKVPEVLYE